MATENSTGNVHKISSNSGDHSPANSSTVAKPLPREAWHAGWCYEGTRDELRGAGLALPAEFPGDPGQRKKVRRNRDAGPGEWLSIYRRGKLRFQVLLRYTAAEQAAYDSQQKAEYAQSQKARMEGALDNWLKHQRANWVARVVTPEGREKVKVGLLNNFGMAADMLLNATCSKSLPYNFDPDVIAEIAEHLQEIGRLYMAAEMRVKPVALAEADTAFQSMIQGLMGAAVPPDHGAPSKQ